MNRIMCIDYGDARIGVALTDPLKIIVTAHSTIPNDEKSISILADIFREKSVFEVVIGMPYGKDGEMGEAALKVVSFAEELNNFFNKNSFDFILYYQDERYSTRDAAQTMRDIGVKNKRKKALVDQIAACNILKNFLDSRYKEVAEFKDLGECCD